MQVFVRCTESTSETLLKFFYISGHIQPVYNYKNHTFPSSSLDRVLPSRSNSTNQTENIQTQDQYLNAYPSERWNSLRCKICSEVTASRFLLQKHMSTLHASEMPFSCPLCNKGFFTQSGLSRHIEDHDSKRIPCTYCSMQFKRKQYLVHHLKTVHKLFPCLYCLLMFNSKEELNYHVINCGKK